MTEMLTLTRRQARRFILAHQGLYPPREGVGKEEILAFIRRVGCIQFDPLDVVGRNPDLVLQSRIARYRPEMLDALLYEDRALVDGWDKNMSIYPVEDWPYFHRQREAMRHQPRRTQEAIAQALPEVRQALETRGPLSSLDLKFDKTVDWSWAPTRLARAALESMYGWGELIVHHKVHTRKVYDFAARHLPEEILTAPDPNATNAAYHDWYVRRRIGSVGLLWNRAGGAWLGIRGFRSPERRAALKRLSARGEVVSVRIDGLRPAFYLRRADQSRLQEVLNDDETEGPPRASFLAPLDNVLWDRKLVQELFGFEYIWEVYKPVEERRYGYYVLPVLYGDQFVARFEPTLDKEQGQLAIKGWWWEPEVEPTEAMRTAILEALRAFLRYLGAESVAVDKTGPTWLLAIHDR